jgi:F-type H+-transporting ATPase subunit alpha
MPSTSNKNIKEIGHIASYFSGVAKIKGLPHVFLDEVLLDERGQEVAIVVGFDEEFVEALFFDENYDPQKPVYRSQQIFSRPVSEDYLGRVVDGLGQPIDGLGEISGKSVPVFSAAPQIIEREPVKTPLSTGIKIIDTTLPLGRGQRELIIGDRNLGKSTLAIDVVLNQKNAQPSVYCIYVVCGQKEQKLKELIYLFRKYNAFLYSVIVAAPAGASFAQQYLAPFVGCTIGQYFRDQGKDALIVYDDLSKHAKIYRDISLLLERAPGRESYPGDIFSLHAGLLERAAKLSKNKGGGSLTALPIIETQEDDITSFIPTNLISITDGQIYLERGLYQKGFLPAVNVGLSVSRVGSQAQPTLLKKMTGGIRLALAQHKELQKLVQLETVVSQESQKRIQRGQLMVELLKQEKHTCISWPEQVILFWLAGQGFFDDLEKENWEDFEKLLLELIRTRYQRVLTKISQGQWNEEIENQVKAIILDFKKEFLSHENLS